MGNINIANLPTTKQETASGNCTVLCTHCPSEHDETYWIGIHFHSSTVTFSFIVLLIFPGCQNIFLIDFSDPPSSFPFVVFYFFQDVKTFSWSTLSDLPSSPFSFVVLLLFPRSQKNIFFFDSSCPIPHLLLFLSWFCYFFQDIKAFPSSTFPILHLLSLS